MLHYDELIAPDRHSGVLIAPGAQELAILAQRNASSLRSTNVLILGRTLGDWRALTRKRHRPDRPNENPIIIVGHQPGLIHAGVWAKNVVAHRIAKSLDGTALHLVVDSDAPRNLLMRVPVEQQGRWTIRSAALGKAPLGGTFEQVPGLDGDAQRLVEREVRELVGARYPQTLLPRFFEGVRTSDGDWVAQVIAGRKAIEDEFGIEVRDLRIRDAWWSPLAGQLLLDARGFAKHYNEAIEAYRDRYGVRSPNRPVPPLQIEPERVEVPFWLYDENHPRNRAFLSEQAGSVEIQSGSETVASFSHAEIERSNDLMEEIRQRSGWCLRPRALITTLWSRLFVADLFIHGIGGAKYDRITDMIMASYFRVPVPEIACVTATLYLDPKCDESVSPADLERQIRDMTWNPQRQSSAPGTAAFRELVNRKRAAIEKSSALAGQRPADRDARKTAYEVIRSLNGQIAALNPHSLKEIQSRLEQVRVALADRRALCDREYFFALHSRENVECLLAALPAGADFVPT